MVLAAFVVFNFIKNRSWTVSLYASQVAARNINFPDLKNGKLRFFTGTAIAELNLQTLNSRSLTREYELPEISTLRWGGEKIVLKAEKLSPNDDLYDLADTAVRDSSYSWWLLDLRTDTISPFSIGRSDQKIVDVIWDSSRANLIVLAQNGDSPERQLLARVDIKSNVISSITVKNAVLIADFSGTTALMQDSALFLWQQNNLKNTGLSILKKPKISEATSSLYFEPKKEKEGGGLWQYRIDQQKQQLIVDVSLNSGNYESLQKGLLSLPVPPDSQSEYNPKNGFLLYEEGENQKLKLNINLDGQDALRLGTITSAWVLAPPSEKIVSIAAVNSTGNLHLLSTSSAIRGKASPYPLFIMDELERTANGYILSYNAVANKLTIRVDDPSNIQSARKRIVQELQIGGKDPNQVNKEWLQRIIQSYE